MRRWATSLALIALLLPAAASATTPQLQVSPLEYQSTLQGTTVKVGYVDVANPSDSQIEVKSSIQAFRQIDSHGTLEYYNDPALASGIVVASNDFLLGPRQAVRVPFSINPEELPQTGVNAVIFFETVPPAQSNGGNVITESVRVGTLLVLNNGGIKPQGKIAGTSVPYWQFGNDVSGSLTYRNTASASGVAFNPSLGLKLGWGRQSYTSGPLIFPGNQRLVSLKVAGSYVGWLPLKIHDQQSGQTVTVWVLACTGLWRWLLPALIIFITLAAWLWRRRHLP